MKYKLHILLLTCLLALLTGCKTTTHPADTDGAQLAPLGDNAAAEDWEEFEDEIEYNHHSDPLEGFNRAMFSFNDGLYDYVLRPVSKGYTKVTPKVFRSGISNFFDNVRYPVRLVNQILQGKFETGLRETGMFLVNTTYGLAGFIDHSEEFPGLDVPPEDFGQTLGVWGIGDGPYLVLPVLGPSSLRDTVGRAGDHFANPTSYLGYWQWEADWSARGVETINALPGQVSVYDAVVGSALDDYTAVKDGYLQMRKRQIEE